MEIQVAHLEKNFFFLIFQIFNLHKRKIWKTTHRPVLAASGLKAIQASRKIYPFSLHIAH